MIKSRLQVVAPLVASLLRSRSKLVVATLLRFLASLETDNQIIIHSSIMTTLGDLCSGRFEPLRDYLTGVTLYDVKDVDVQTATNMVEPEHRFLILAFWKTYVEPEIQATDIGEDDDDALSKLLTRVRNPAENDQITHSKIRLSAHKDALLLAQKVVNSRYVRVHPESDIIGTNELATVISQMSSEARDGIKLLDLSRNRLNNVVMTDIENAVGVLPNCNILVLRNNQFSGTSVQPFRDQLALPLNRILKLEQVRFVDICINHLGVDVLEDDTALSKVIFLPMSVFDGIEMCSFIGKYDKADVVIRTHMAYYALIKESYSYVL